MAWFKVDHNMRSHPAVLGVGDAALGYWLRLGCWLATFPQQYDFIPEAVAVHLLYGRRKRALLDTLVDSGLLIPDGDGYRMGPSAEAWDVEVPSSRRKAIPDATRLQVYERDGFKCLHCGTSERLTLDHVHPWSMGGSDDATNLQTLCGSCNSRKGARV